MPAAAALLATITDPWESLTQALRDGDPDHFGDPARAGTPAFHLRHTAEVFRLHARKLIAAIDPAAADRLPREDQPVPLGGSWSPGAVLGELAEHARVVADWLDGLPPQALSTTFEHSGRETTAGEFLDMMTRHVVWHAAAVYYRSRPAPEG